MKTKPWMDAFGYMALCLIYWLNMASEAPSALVPVTTRCHVVGMYMPEDHNKDDRVYVRIQATEHPMIIVLCSYFGTEWNISIDPKAKVEKIIVSGWFESTTNGTIKTAAPFRSNISLVQSRRGKRITSGLLAGIQKKDATCVPR